MNRLKLYTYRFLHILQIHIFQTLVVAMGLFFLAIPWVGPLLDQIENQFWGYSFVFGFVSFMCLWLIVYGVAIIGREAIPIFSIPISRKLALFNGLSLVIPSFLVLLVALIAYIWYAVIPLFYGFFQ